MIKIEEYLPADNEHAGAEPAAAPTPPAAGGEAELRRLAALPPLDYDRAREAAAKAMGVRVAVLDGAVGRLRPNTGDAKGQGARVTFNDPEPWPEPVNGAALLDELAATFARHLILPPGAADALALWTVSTYCTVLFEFSPIMLITAPERECGKSRVRDVAILLVFRPQSTDSATPAFLFRVIEMHRPTLFLDEFDNADLETRRELLAIVNGGYQSVGAVGRVAGEALEPRKFSTFCPKMVIAVGCPLPDTTRSRCIAVPMRRKLRGEAVVSMKGVDYGDARRLCARWVGDHGPALVAAQPEPVAGLSDRQQDVTEPLLAIAGVAGGGWPERARLAIALLCGKPEAEPANLGTLLLADIRDAFAAAGTDRLPTADLLARLNAMAERPWPTACKGRELNAHRLGTLLKGYGTSSRNIRLQDGSTPKGFHLDQFMDAFGRYLSSPPPGNPALIRHTATTLDGIDQNLLFGNATPEACGVSENALSVNNDGPCGGVADKNREPLPQGEEGVLL